MSPPLWTCIDPTLAPATAAELYAGGRKVLDFEGLELGGLFAGQWGGRFRFTGGRCWLNLWRDGRGVWEVREGAPYEGED